MIERNSLSFRLAASAATVSLVLLVAAGILLGYLFREAVERNFDARLQAVLDGLLASVELGTDSQLTMPGALAGTRFKLPLSGWYWQVTALGQPRREMVSASLLEQISKQDAGPHSHRPGSLERQGGRLRCRCR